MASNNNAEDVSSSKISVLNVLDRLGVGIRHRQTIITQLDGSSEAPEIVSRLESLKRAITKDIKAYIDTCIAGIRDGAILHDPFDIVYDRGFKEGTYAESVSRAYLQEIMASDEDGFLASIQLKDGIEKQYNVSVALKDGAHAIYNAVKNTIGYVRGAVVEWVDLCAELIEAVSITVIYFWHWLMQKIYSGWTTMKSWFSRTEVVPEVVVS